MSDIFSGILSLDHLFSYTFPDRPSFLTSFGVEWFPLGFLLGSKGVKRVAGSRRNFIALLAYTVRLTLSRQNAGVSRQSTKFRLNAVAKQNRPFLLSGRVYS